MAEAQEQSGLSDLMKQLLEKVNDLQAGQIQNQDEMRGIRARTDAMEARIVEPSAGVTAATAATAAGSAPPPIATAPPMSTTSSAPGGVASSSGTASAAESFYSTGMPRDMGYGSSDHRVANLHRGDAPGILGYPVPAPGAGAPSPGNLTSLVNHVSFGENRDRKSVV